MQRTAKPPVKTVALQGKETGFAAVVRACRHHRQVTYGGKGFGSSALKVNGKIFAMLSSKRQFVVKLPKERVDELVQTRKGRYFDPGRGKLMKEWLAVKLPEADWLKLAEEACEFVRRGTPQKSRSR